jgi:hypothetical protein
MPRLAFRQPEYQEVPNFGKLGTKTFRTPFARTKRKTVIGNMDPTFTGIVKFTAQPWLS